MNHQLTNNKLIDQTRLNVGVNLANVIDPKLLRKIYDYMLNHYILPQIMGRKPYEQIWNTLYDAYRMRLKIKELKLTKDDSEFLKLISERAVQSGSRDVNLTDTLIFDTVDRMSNLAHFITWKDDMPIQFNPLRNQITPGEDKFYAPTSTTFKSLNAVLEYFVGKSNCYRKTRLSNKDYYLYGIGFATSHLNYRLEDKGDGNVVLRNLDISFDPISIRKCWINFMLPLSEMRQQPCPFWYDYSSHFAILQNPYEPVLNPFGYVNLDKLDNRFYTAFAGEAEQSAMDALKARLASAGQCLNISMAEWKDIACHWQFYPMLPFDDQTGEFEMRADGKTKVPFKRFVWEHFGTDIISGAVTPIRLQNCDYYEGDLPIYGSTHLEDLDSGAYGMSICEALINYAIELSTMRMQYVENKNKINNPPTYHMAGSPSMNQDVNKAGAKIEVQSPTDFGWAQVPDATQTTVQMSEHIRERAQTTSKAVDAIMGKAMGGRTTATEAQNAFQAAMSGVTTDININNFDIMGGFAQRVYKWSGWLDMDVLKAITGSYGMELTPEDRQLQFSLKYDVGSSYIESIVKQGHIRYFLETGMRAPGVIDIGKCFVMLADELRIKGLRECLIPDGVDRNIQKSTEQAIQTYLGNQVMIDPSQDHNVAIEVKIRFLEDLGSVWNTQYGALPYLNSGLNRAQALAQQIQIHQNYLNLQIQQQMMSQIANLQMNHAANAPEPPGNGIPSLSEGSPARETMPSNQGAV